MSYEFLIILSVLFLTKNAIFWEFFTEFYVPGTDCFFYRNFLEKKQTFFWITRKKNFGKKTKKNFDKKFF